MTFEGKGGKMHNAATLADKIGMNRVIAGYHYMSDHQAGLLLANQLVLKITKNLHRARKILHS